MMMVAPSSIIGKAVHGGDNVQKPSKGSNNNTTTRRRRRQEEGIGEEGGRKNKKSNGRQFLNFEIRTTTILHRFSPY